MKRKVLCVFSLLLLLLTFCTLFSPKAEEEMQLLADTRKINGSSKAVRNVSVGKIALTWENSKDVIFNIVEGDGWESGLRVTTIPSIYYDDKGGHVTLGPGTGYWYVYSASREPKPGDSVLPLEKSWKAADTYLLVASRPLEELDYLRAFGMTERQRSENAVLVDVKKAVYPFLEHRVWYSLKDKMGEDVRIYSLHDISQFLDAMPWIAGVATALLCSLLLWGASWLGRVERKKWMLLLNILLIAALMGLLPWLLSQFDLPASMMPAEFILDISHYAENFERIFSSLQAMGSDVLDAAAAQASNRSLLVALAGILTTAAVITGEMLLLNRKKKEKMPVQ